MDLTLTHDTQLNPDGSGKVSIRWEGGLPSPDVQAPDFMNAELMNGKGIDAWSEPSCTIEDGKLTFQATVYFRDPSKLRFHCQGFHANVLDLLASTDDQGNLVVRTPAPEMGAGPAVGSEEELLARLPAEREKFAVAKEFIGGMVGGLVCVGSLRLPGKVGKVKNWKKSGPDTVAMRFEGKTILDLLERLMTDDALALKLLKSGKEGPDALLALLGDQGPLDVVTTGKLKPLFDYDGEVAAAKERFAALAESLNLPKPPELAPPMKNVRIVAAKHVREADGDRDLCPMGQNYASYSVTIVGDAPEGAVKADEGRMEAAITDAGANLVPEDEWQRRISWPKLTKDRKTVFFDVELRFGDAAVDGFRELRGLISLMASSGTEDVDLGIKKLETGAAGTACGATIERFEPQDEERTSLELKLQIAMDLIESVRLLTPKGEELPFVQNGYSSSGDECTLNFTIEGAIPKKAKLVARLAKNLHRLEVPFEVRDVDLLGRPRGRE